MPEHLTVGKLIEALKRLPLDADVYAFVSSEEFVPLTNDLVRHQVGPTDTYVPEGSVTIGGYPTRR